MNVAMALDLTLRAAGIPIEGVSIGRENDPSTWRVHYTADATDAQRTAGAAILTAFDPTTQAVADRYRAAVAADADADLLLQALGTVVWRELQKCTPTAGQSMLTAAQFKAAIKAAYQNLLQ